MPWVEVRGNSIRVKWWGGEFKAGADGKPTKTKVYESASGPEPGVPFESEDEAFDYGLDREHDRRHGNHIARASAGTPMESYCWDWYASNRLRPHSQKAYRSMLKSVIVPYWTGRPIGEITPIEYDLWKRQVRAKYSDNYAGQILGLFKMLMDDAVIKYKARRESPVVEQRRRGRYEKKATRRVKRNLPLDAVYRLAVNAYHVWGYTGWVYIWTIAFTGMRPPGEMYGLQRGYASPTWPAFDPDGEQREEAAARYGSSLHALRVQYQLYAVEKAPTLAGPKYESHRTLVVPPFLHEMHAVLLASHGSPFVFTSMVGKPLLNAEFSKSYWRPIRDGAPERTGRRDRVRPALPAVEEMAGQDIYRLRHWHRELLDEPGADIARVAKEARMGHELPGVEGIYSMVTLAMEERIVEYLQGVWEKLLARGLWLPPSPISLPPERLQGEVPLFSAYPILD